MNMYYKKFQPYVKKSESAGADKSGFARAVKEHEREITQKLFKVITDETTKAVEDNSGGDVMDVKALEMGISLALGNLLAGTIFANSMAEHTLGNPNAINVLEELLKQAMHQLEKARDQATELIKE
jgi:hypothetical protein